LRFRGGATLADSRSNYSMSGSNRNQYAGGYSKISSTPNGYTHPGSWIMGNVAGGMSTYGQLDASIQETITNLVSGRNLDASMTGSISITQGQLDQIANMLASLSGNINITQAQLDAAANLQAAITASMVVTDAQLGAIIGLMASLNGSISLTDASVFATADISADMSLTNGAATPAQIAQAVWDEPLALHTTSGSYGVFVKKLLTVAKFLGLK